LRGYRVLFLQYYNGFYPQVSDQLFVDILNATIELDIAYLDIDWGNIGISVVDKRFLIVDASMRSGFEA